MGEKLLPLSMQELCAHALELERDAGARFREYAKRMRELGSERVAREFDAMVLEQETETRALQAAAGNHPPAELTPWEHAWRRTYLPDGLDGQPRAVPADAREALEYAALAKRRAERFYRDVADHTVNDIVRSCADEMAAAERRQILRIEMLLAWVSGESGPPAASWDGDARLSR